MVDAIVVGARCAGSPVAMLLARRGHRVVLVDRARFPSDTLSTHFMFPVDGLRLAEWGLLPELIAAGVPPITTWSSYRGDFLLSGTPPPVRGTGVAYASRRTVLDKVLVDGAAAAGADVREGFVVEDLLWDGDRVVGIRGRSGGRTIREQAQVVVGADGRHSFVAQRVGSRAEELLACQTCTYYAYWQGVDVAGVESYNTSDPPRVLLTYPTNGGLVLTVAQWPKRDFHRVRADVEGNVRAVLSLMPGLAERFARGRVVGRFLGTADQDNIIRTAHGPGWALVGDAGLHVDPRNAQGMRHAFQSAVLLADALDAALRGQVPVLDALAAYQRQRDAAQRPDFEATCRSVRFPPPSDDDRRLRAALRRNQPDTDRFFGVTFGSVPRAEFYAPDNLARILSAAPVPWGR